uniref:Mitochondrial transcription termination factor family protein n=1 Tax=Davidia involucrata TaxID=16924 RepID=A0A5B7CDJ9_DAVIN
MFLLIYKSLSHHRIKHTTSTIVRFLQTQPISNNSNLTEKQSLTVSYLTKSCGLSWESAISASKTVHIESTEKPDSVLELLRSHGFTENNIATLISRHPPLILADPEKTLRPKIEFFESLGIVGPELPRILCSHRSILLSSLKNQIMPTFDFLKRYIQTNENLIYALKQSSRVVMCNVEKVMVPNISTLCAQGVPESHIGKLIMLQPRSLMLRIDLFEEVCKVLKEMGFDPTSRSYILAVRSMSVNSKLNWEKKKEVLMSFGWSESEFNLAFKVQPMCMICSEKKIREVMDFFVNKVGLKASDIAKCPNLLLTSLERRIIPRCSVLLVLMSKGLIEKKLDVIWLLNRTKKNFETKFVTRYKEVAPDVIKAYQGEIGFQGFTTRMQDIMKSKKRGISQTC